MKIHKEQSFTPVIITLESHEEVEMLRHLIDASPKEAARTSGRDEREVVKFVVNAVDKLLKIQQGYL